MIVTDDLSCPIDENTVLFIDKEPQYDEDGKPLYDYMVAGSPSPSTPFPMRSVR